MPSYVSNSGPTCKLQQDEHRHPDDPRWRHDFHPTSLPPSHPQIVCRDVSTPQRPPWPRRPHNSHRIRTRKSFLKILRNVLPALLLWRTGSPFLPVVDSPLTRSERASELLALLLSCSGRTKKRSGVERAPSQATDSDLDNLSHYFLANKSLMNCLAHSCISYSMKM